MTVVDLFTEAGSETAYVKIAIEYCSNEECKMAGEVALIPRGGCRRVIIYCDEATHTLPVRCQCH